VRCLYKGALRTLLVLLHDFPEFLGEHHGSLCDAIPATAIQARAAPLLRRAPPCRRTLSPRAPLLPSSPPLPPHSPRSYPQHLPLNLLFNLPKPHQTPPKPHQTTTQ